MITICPLICSLKYNEVLSMLYWQNMKNHSLHCSTAYSSSWHTLRLIQLLQATIQCIGECCMPPPTPATHKLCLTLFSPLVSSLSSKLHCSPNKQWPAGSISERLDSKELSQPFLLCLSPQHQLFFSKLGMNHVFWFTCLCVCVTFPSCQMLEGCFAYVLLAPGQSSPGWAP